MSRLQAVGREGIGAQAGTAGPYRLALARTSLYVHVLFDTQMCYAQKSGIWESPLATRISDQSRRGEIELTMTEIKTK